MNKCRKQAMEILDRLYLENQIDCKDYCGMRHGLEGIETLRDRDEELEELWEQLSDVPVDPDTEKLEEDWLIFPRGTDKEDIWHWFDKRHSKGVAYLLYNDGIDRTDQFAKLMYLKQFCFECESQTCQYNHGGECRFALVHERKPRINNVDGCIDYDYQEGDE